MLILIAGGTGSGKTTLTKKLCERFPDGISVMCHDNYYKGFSELPLEERAKQNYDSPDAFETDFYISDIRRLLAGEEIECPVYDYKNHTRSGDTFTVKPAPVVIAEGILVLSYKELREMADIKLFVDADADERVLRRMKRDTEKRGRSIQSVTEQYLSTVKPMHDKYVEPSKRYADIVIVGGGKNPVALDMITQRIDREIKESSALREPGV